MDKRWNLSSSGFGQILKFERSSDHEFNKRERERMKKKKEKRKKGEEKEKERRRERKRKELREKNK